MEEVIKVNDCGENIGDYDISIHNAIIVPENATNGEVLKMIFPKLEIRDRGGDFITYTLNGVGGDIERKWWNAPYKG